MDNIFVFNLLLSMDEGNDPARLAHVTLADFLARLTRQSVTDPEGRERRGWVYDADATPAPAAAGSRRYALIVDQFEEIVTSHPGRWREREDFFRQLDAAMRADPNLWVVLTLREDYVAALDPYAPFVADRLRARFYMERMGVAAGLDAIRKPAELAGRPFAEGVAEKLADELRQVRVPGQEATVAGQYVEPVQLQVVCYQLWEGLREAEIGERRPEIGDWGGERSSKAAAGERRAITFEDLARAGDVDRALTQFYEETLAAALADPAAAGVSERQIRTWFDEKLITEEGTRGLVHQGESDAGGLSNGVVRALQRRFLVRAEARGGNAWIELVHDRFVEPIRASNAAWFPQHLSALQRQAALWDEQGRSDGLLLSGKALAAAEGWAAGQTEPLEAVEQEFLGACQRAQAVAERERRQSRRIRILGIAAFAVAVLAIVAAFWGWRSSAEAIRQRQIADDNAKKAVAAQATAEANAALAQAQLDRQIGLRLLQEAFKMKEEGDAKGAIEKLRATKATDTDLGIDVDEEIEDVRRKVATQLVHRGEQLAAENDYAAAYVKLQEALELDPPPDTPIYAWIPASLFIMGASSDDSQAYPDQMPQHKVWVNGYWIQRTEVTNEQFGRCMQIGECQPPHNSYWNKQQYAKLPVTHVDWFQANSYANWVGGRLPTEAEWENACRGVNSYIYSWGDHPPSPSLTSFVGSGLPLPNVIGSFSAGTYGLYDMSGNVWEWTSTLDRPYPYAADDGREDQTITGVRVLRGGAFGHDGDTDFGVSCIVRGRGGPYGLGGYYGFRVVLGPNTENPRR